MVNKLTKYFQQSNCIILIGPNGSGKTSTLRQLSNNKHLKLATTVKERLETSRLSSEEIVIKKITNSEGTMILDLGYSYLAKNINNEIIYIDEMDSGLSMNNIILMLYPFTQKHKGTKIVLTTNSYELIQACRYLKLNPILIQVTIPEDNWYDVKRDDVNVNFKELEINSYEEYEDFIKGFIDKDIRRQFE